MHMYNNTMTHCSISDCLSDIMTILPYHEGLQRSGGLQIRMDRWTSVLSFSIGVDGVGCISKSASITSDEELEEIV